MNYETNEILNWIMNDEQNLNNCIDKLNDFDRFKFTVFMLFVKLNNQFDLINCYDFELSELNYNELFDYLNEYIKE